MVRIRSTYSEQLFMTAADLLVSEGYADLGYKYVIVDDCWLSVNRTADGMLQADTHRFPSGIKALSDYVSVLIPQEGGPY